MNKGAMKNMGVGIFFLVFALVYMFGASKIVSFTPFGNRGLDSQSIPQMLGVLMCALAILQLALTALQNKKTLAKKVILQSERQGGTYEKAPPPKKDARDAKIAAIGSIGLLVAYVAVYMRLGFILSTILYLIASVTLLAPPGQRRKMILFVIPFSVIFTFTVYVAFTKYLTLMLPRGMLG